MKVIEIVVTPEGKSNLQTRGFSGTACRDASRYMEQALGIRTAESVTAEFHQSEQIRQHQHQQS